MNALVLTLCVVASSCVVVARAQNIPSLREDRKIEQVGGQAVGRSAVDGITVSGNQAFVTRNGVTEVLTQQLVLDNGIRISPTGIIRVAGGRHLALASNQILGFDGTIISAVNVGTPGTPAIAEGPGTGGLIFGSSSVATNNTDTGGNPNFFNVTVVQATPTPTPTTTLFATQITRDPRTGQLILSAINPITGQLVTTTTDPRTGQTVSTTVVNGRRVTTTTDPRTGQPVTITTDSSGRTIATTVNPNTGATVPVVINRNTGQISSLSTTARTTTSATGTTQSTASSTTQPLAPIASGPTTTVRGTSNRVGFAGGTGIAGSRGVSATTKASGGSSSRATGGTMNSSGRR